MKRRFSTVAHVGNIAIGGENPVRIQSMATVDTNDTEGCVAQAKRIIDAGGELVRFTTQGTREAENMRNISARLKADGYQTPLVADVHFTAHVADVAAQYCEKVRINPGNYVDPGRTFKHLEYTDEEYAAELQKIDQRLVPFINICKEHHTAVRIGVNHGSLSDRIMSRYGDTPAGIVESCMEFLRIFKREAFNDVVISIKASNTVVMVQSVRLLVQAMDAEDMHYPLHLGVTEAGEGEDGRIKSAVGIGALLTEGIGDTIRVSLSEEPEAEIPVARKLVELIDECTRLRHEAEASITDDTLTLTLDAPDWETLQLKAAMAAGSTLIDRKATKLVIQPLSGSPFFTLHSSLFTALADAILQAARIKFTKPEYISCPGCGRTLYNLQDTIARIKAATKHLVGVKIGIMGCIVNGPGEMADADYGYVGAGRGKISLYRQKVCVEKNIPEEEAVEHLLALISANEK
ncbi:MAG: (E)-4-hydroxy-3-methylbut-2-enyl-diphosphate synthase [Prevotella sp.]|nr:(E)-4-hydroxy-3-methylbut-2-enyl-diphosphate synthase [Prevotella sp.]MBQ9654627.1 (E)-4-hydroxy-3-methylbut-2-enyl-diphosphate synthase [Prevotella sp.]